jgi:hypothetical protein
MVFMAKVTISGVKNVSDSIRKLFDEVKSDEGLLTELGNNVVDLTKKFNQAGQSPQGGSHKRISTAWIDRKEELKKNKSGF